MLAPQGDGTSCFLTWSDGRGGSGWRGDSGGLSSGGGVCRWHAQDPTFASDTLVLLPAL